MEVVADGTRLISLFGDITEIVYALGAREFLVARDASSIYPPEAEQLPNLGFAGSLNVEAILNLEPTLTVGTAMASPPEVLEQLRQAGVEVLILEELKGLDAPQLRFHVISMADLYLLGFGPRLPEAIADLAEFPGEVQDQVLESE